MTASNTSRTLWSVHARLAYGRTGEANSCTHTQSFQDRGGKGQDGYREAAQGGEDSRQWCCSLAAGLRVKTQQFSVSGAVFCAVGCREGCGESRAPLGIFSRGTKQIESVMSLTGKWEFEGRGGKGGRNSGEGVCGIGEGRLECGRHGAGGILGRGHFGGKRASWAVCHGTHCSRRWLQVVW